MTRPGRIYASALAKFVHAAHLRGKATGRVRDAERRYDVAFPGGACVIEAAHDGGLRIVSPDESEVINVRPADEGRLFRYCEAAPCTP